MAALPPRQQLEQVWPVRRSPSAPAVLIKPLNVVVEIRSRVKLMCWLIQDSVAEHRIHLSQMLHGRNHKFLPPLLELDAHVARLARNEEIEISQRRNVLLMLIVLLKLYELRYHIEHLWWIWDAYMPLDKNLAIATFYNITRGIIMRLH